MRGSQFRGQPFSSFPDYFELPNNRVLPKCRGEEFSLPYSHVGLNSLNSVQDVSEVDPIVTHKGTASFSTRWRI